MEVGTPAHLPYGIAHWGCHPTQLSPLSLWIAAKQNQVTIMIWIFWLIWIEKH